MKKLNRKGFTLVELLAVIVILAIVVGIAIPSVTSVINNSKKKGLETAVEAAGSYLTKQSQLMNVASGATDTEFNVMTTTLQTFKSSNTALWTKLGFKTSNVSAIKARYNSDGTACIQIAAIPKNSEYYTVSDWTEMDATEASTLGLDAGTYYKPNTTGIKSSYGSCN